MKYVTLIVSAVSLVLASGPALGAVTNDSSTWEGSYEGVVKPSSDGWTAFGGADSKASLLGGGILRIDSINYGASPWYQNLETLNLSTGVTAGTYEGPGVSMEWRLKMLDYEDPQTATAAARFYIYADDGSGNIKQRSMGFSKTMAGESSNLFPMDTTDGFHVYRFTMDSAGYKFYVDGSHVRTGSLGATSGATRLEFGDVTGGQDSDYELDYIRWTDGGAFNTIPEPASLVMMAVSGVLLLGRRRSA